MAFVYPGVTYLVLFKDHPGRKDSTLEKAKYYGAMFCVVFGLIFAVVVTVATFINDPVHHGVCNLWSCSYILNE